MIEGEYWSVDPYQRIQQSSKPTWEEPAKVGEVQRGGMVGKVIQSKSNDLKPGDWVNVYGGWQQYVCVPASSARKLDENQAPVTTALGCLGMPGRIAYFGFLEGKPKEGETVVVSGKKT